MKIRTGFVSNSSSSSFVVLLPDNFTKEDLDFSKAKHVYDASQENICKLFEDLKKEKYLDLYSEVLDEEDVYEAMHALEQILGDFVIASIDTGPDRGSIELVNMKRVKKILGV